MQLPILGGPLGVDGTYLRVQGVDLNHKLGQGIREAESNEEPTFQFLEGSRFQFLGSEDVQRGSHRTLVANEVVVKVSKPPRGRSKPIHNHLALEVFILIPLA